MCGLTGEKAAKPTSPPSAIEMPSIKKVSQKGSLAGGQPAQLQSASLPKLAALPFRDEHANSTASLRVKTSPQVRGVADGEGVSSPDMVTSPLGVNPPKGAHSPPKAFAQSAIASPKVSSPLQSGALSASTSSKKITSPVGSGAMSAGTSAKKVISPPTPFARSALTSPYSPSAAAAAGVTWSEVVSSPPNPSATAAAAAVSPADSSLPKIPEASEEVVPAIGAATEIAAAAAGLGPPRSGQVAPAPAPAKADKRIRSTRDITLKRKRIAAVGDPGRAAAVKKSLQTGVKLAGRIGAAAPGAAAYGGLASIPLPQPKAKPVEEPYNEEEMDEDYPYRPRQSGQALPCAVGHAAGGFDGKPGHFTESPGQVAGQVGAALPATKEQLGRVNDDVGQVREALVVWIAEQVKKPQLRQDQQPQPGHAQSSPEPVIPLSPSLAGWPTDPRLKPEHLGSVTEPQDASQGSCWHSRQHPHTSSTLPDPTAPTGIASPGFWQVSSQPVKGPERLPPHAFLRSLESSAAPRGPSEDPREDARQQPQPTLQSQGSLSGSQGSGQHPRDKDMPPSKLSLQSRGTAVVPQSSALHPQGHHKQSQRYTPSETGTPVCSFGVLRPVQLSAQPESMAVKLSYKWGEHSCVAGVLDLVAWSWSTKRVGMLWAAAGWSSLSSSFPFCTDLLMLCCICTLQNA